jgi:hypothetical protein
VKGEGVAKASAQAKEARAYFFVLKLRVNPQRCDSRVGSATISCLEECQGSLCQNNLDRCEIMTHPKKPLLMGETTRSFELVRESLIKRQLNPVKGEGVAKALAQAKEARSYSFVLKLPRCDNRKGSATLAMPKQLMPE